MFERRRCRKMAMKVKGETMRECGRAKVSASGFHLSARSQDVAASMWTRVLIAFGVGLLAASVAALPLNATPILNDSLAILEVKRVTTIETARIVSVDADEDEESGSGETPAVAGFVGGDDDGGGGGGGDFDARLPMAAVPGGSLQGERL